MYLQKRRAEKKRFNQNEFPFLRSQSGWLATQYKRLARGIGYATFMGQM